MIASFKSRALKDFYLHGKGGKVLSDLRERVLRRLDALDNAATLEELNVPGISLHRRHGKPARHSIHVNGPWCITFAWLEGEAWRVELEQYH